MSTLLLRVLKFTAAAGAMSGVGALFLSLYGEVSRRIYCSILGFSAGVMMGVSTVILLPHALQIGSLPVVLVGMVAGGLFATLLEVGIPHMEPHFGADEFSPGLGDAVALALAVAIHNIPEGLAMGLGFAAGNGLGPLLVVAVGCQNIPEGLAISLPLRRNGVDRWKSVAFATLSGMSEMIGAALAVAASRWAESILPVGLAFAAGALIYVTAEQLIPESHHREMGIVPSWGLVLGFAMVMVISEMGIDF